MSGPVARLQLLNYINCGNKAKDSPLNGIEMEKACSRQRKVAFIVSRLKWSHDGLFIFSDLFGIDLNFFYYSALHVSASSPGHMLITTKVVLATFPFPLGESESCSKTKRCTRKRFH